MFRCCMVCLKKEKLFRCCMICRWKGKTVSLLYDLSLERKNCFGVV